MRSRGDVSIGYLRKHAIGEFSNFTNTLLPDSCVILHGNASQPICKWHFRWHKINKTVLRSSEISISGAFGFRTFYSVFSGVSVSVYFDHRVRVGFDLVYFLNFDGVTLIFPVSVPSVRAHSVEFDTSNSRGEIENKCDRFVWKCVFHSNEFLFKE